MGLVRSSIPRSRVPWHRRVRTDRRAIRRWVVVAALAAATGGSVAGSVAGGEASRHRWGTTAPVLVTTSPVVAGDDLAQHTAVRRWPVALVPDGALARLPPGARAAVALPTGTALSTALLAATTGSDVAGRVVVAVPVGGASPSVAEADRVDVWDAATGRARAVARGAVVTAVRGESVELAVADDDVAGLVTAVAVGTVVLVALPPGG